MKNLNEKLCKVKKMIYLYSTLLFHLVVLSCNEDYEQYHADWIINKFELEGKNELDLIWVYNFKIDLRSSAGKVPALDQGTLQEKRARNCKIEITEIEEKHYLRITEHHFFNGEYEIKCLDETCCKISLRSDTIYMELDYNMDIPFGVTRVCSSPRIPVEKLNLPLTKQEPNG